MLPAPKPFLCLPLPGTSPHCYSLELRLLATPVMEVLRKNSVLKPARLRSTAKAMLVILTITAFLALNCTPSWATPVLADPESTTQQRDWIILPLMVAIALVSLGVATWLILTASPGAEAIVETRADGATDGASMAGQMFAHAENRLTGPLGSTSFGNLLVRNVLVGDPPVGREHSYSPDTSTGMAAPVNGASSGATLTGKANGKVFITRVIGDPGLTVPPSSTTLNFQFSVMGSMSLDPTSLPGSFLSLDLSYDVTPSSSNPYRWGFSASVDPDGLFGITQRRGVFADQDVVLSDRGVLAMTPPPAIFDVPFETPIDVSGGVTFAADESVSVPEIPEPATWLLFGSGLAGLADLAGTSPKFGLALTEVLL